MTKRQRSLASALMMTLCISTYAEAERCERQAGQCDQPGEELKEILRVSAGGPYQARLGVPLTLRGSYTIAGQSVDMAHLQAIGKALDAYLRDHGTYPPAALNNARGQATVSWRVLILPYLGYKDLYDRFDLSKPWYDAANKYLLRDMPAEYRGAECDEHETDTAYAGVEGKNTLFEKASKQLNGGLPAAGIFQTQTLAAGRVGSGVHIPWTAPADVEAANATRLGAQCGFSGGHAFTPLLFLDGTVHLLPNADGSNFMPTWIHVVQTATATPACVCAPPSTTDLGLRAAWDLSNNGTLSANGFEATFVASRAGTYTVVFHVFDRFGNQYSSTAKVEVK